MRRGSQVAAELQLLLPAHYESLGGRDPSSLNPKVGMGHWQSPVHAHTVQTLMTGAGRQVSAVVLGGFCGASAVLRFDLHHCPAGASRDDFRC